MKSCGADSATCQEQTGTVDFAAEARLDSGQPAASSSLTPTRSTPTAASMTTATGKNRRTMPSYMLGEMESPVFSL